MSKPKDVAVIGGGPAGAAVAILLAEQGMNITIFEREAYPKPIGAGIMLQPSGLQVLRNIGVYDEIAYNGIPIHGLYAHNTKGKTVFDVSFKLKNQDLSGLGVHRASLFASLYEKIDALPIQVVNDADICDIKNEGGPLTIVDQNDRTFGTFDAAIIANGARSVLREKYGIARYDRMQPYGALWCKIPHPETFDRIHHIYEGTTKMIGLMPIGYPGHEHNDHPSVNFFYGVTEQYFDDWGPHRFKAWKKEALAMAPEYTDLIEKISDFDELTLTPYNDVLLKSFYHKNIVFAGDAAHATGPHLSSGTNLALMDALILSESFEQGGSIQEIFSRYQANRKDQVNYYHLISRLITPFFQSKTNIAFLRNLFMVNGLKIPFTKKMMIQTIGGIKQGFFNNIDPKYYIC